MVQLKQSVQDLLSHPGPIVYRGLAYVMKTMV